MNKKKVSPLFMFGSMYIFWVNGLLVLMTSAILIYLISDYNIAYDQAGLLLSVQAVGNLISNFLSGWLASHIGRKKTLITAAVLFTIGFGLVAFLPPLYILYIALFITGLGWGSANNMINFLVTRATEGDTGKISIVHTCYSVGAFIAPLMIGLSVNLGLGWRPAVAAIAFLSLLMIPLIMLMPITESNNLKSKHIEDNLHKTRSNNFLRQWRYYLFMLILFCYVGIEVGFSGWLVSYLNNTRSISEARSQSLLSLLWVFMIFGRIAAAVFGNKIRKAPLLMIEAAGCTVSAVILISSQSPVWLTIAVVLMGISLSAFYGICIANAGYLISESALASGLLLSLGGLGATIIPYFAGLISNKTDLINGMWFLAVISLIMTLLTSINAITARIAELKEIKKVKATDFLFPR